MCILLTLTGSSVAYISAIQTIFSMVKIVVRVRWYLFIFKFGYLENFAIIYAKTVMCILLTLTGLSVAFVSAIHSIFSMVKILVRVRRYVIIYKIR